MKKNQNGFSLVEAVLIILVVVVIAVIGFEINFWKRSSTDKVKTTSSNSDAKPVQVANSSDTKTEQELSQITNALDNYPNNSSDGLLPSNLSQLGLKNIDDLSNYSYKVITQPNGGPNTYEYMVCANFDSNTYSSSAYNKYTTNQVGDESSGAHTVSQFSVHSTGQQCFDVNESDPNVGPVVSLVLNGSEKS